MKTKKNKSLTFIITLLILLAASVIFLSGCIGSKPPRYTNDTQNTESVTEETIYGSLKETQNTAAVEQAKTIVVTSEGSVKVVPDTVMVKIEILTEKPTSEEAVNVNSIDSQNVVTAIKTLGENDLKIETSGYSLQPLYNYIENKPPEIYAFRAVTTLLVTTKKVEKIGNIITTAVEAGASDISSISYDLSDEIKKDAKNEALTKAVKDANNKADAIAKALAVDILEIYSVNEAGTSYPGPILYESMDTLKAAAETSTAPPVILPQDLEVTANISIVYIFK
ncbi:MAG: SIMPL domain-containing protein [Candidatus Humimicrobiaceae bacterium]